MLRIVAYSPVVLLALGTLGGTAAYASNVAQQAELQQQKPSTSATPALDPNRKICKTEELIGSRTGGTRICKTASQWEAKRQQAQRNGDQD